MRTAVCTGLLGVALMCAGCVGGGAFSCEQDLDCTDNGPGFCEPTGFCSFADGTCDSGKRYSEFAGSLSKLCVGDEPVDAGGGGDAGPDAMPVADAALCASPVLSYEPANVSCAQLPAAGGAIDINATAVLNTENQTLTVGGASVAISSAVVAQTDAPELLVVATSQFTVQTGQTLDIEGARAAVIVSTGDVTIAGTVSAGARGGVAGPGSDHPTACATGIGANGVLQTNQGNGVAAASGGGGGGYGGAGGVSPAVTGSGGPDSVGGASNGGAELSPLRGGCRGGDGGAAGSGAGGRAGGAVQIVSDGTITVAGVVTSPGAGGAGTTASNRGGGGGGSGGAILLEAVSITNDGAITANGGGGGEGSRTGSPTNAGANANIDNDQAAVGGNGGSANGGDGGNGGALAAAEPGLAGAISATNTGGCGGGGGGVGRIRFLVHGGAVAGGGVVSPPAQ